MKEKRSDQIRAEIAKTDERIAGLQPQMVEFTAKLEAAHSAIVDGNISPEDYRKASTDHSVTQEVVHALFANRDRLERELMAAIEIEENDEILQSIRSAIKKRPAAFDKVSVSRKALNDAADVLLDANEAYRKLQFAVDAGLRKLGIAIDNWPIVPKQMQDKFESVIAGLESIGVTREDVACIMSRPSFPALPNEPVIVAAQNHQAWAISAAREQERLRERDRNDERRSQMQAAAQKKYEDDMKVLAAKQQRGRQWRFNDAEPTVH